MARGKTTPGRRVGLERLETRDVLTLLLSPVSFTATTVAPFQGIVATLSDSTGTDVPNSFSTPPGSVQIDWGDGHTTAGQVVGPVYPGVFDVLGTHPYTATGTFTTHVSVADQAGASASASGQASISAQPPALTVAVSSFSGQTGVPLPASTQVAAFVVTNASATQGDFQALITWGDGHVSLGQVSGANGAFAVTGTNTYSATGTYPVNVTVLDLIDSTSASASGQAVISSVPTLTASGTTFFATPGVALPATTVVASFNDSNPAYVNNPHPTSLPIALINWGDGQTTSGKVNLISTSGTGGRFTVTGSHTYATSDPSPSYPVVVTIFDPNGPTAQANSMAELVSPVTATGLTFAVTPGTPLVGQTVATFNDPNTDAGSSAAVIAWGDGQTSPGTVHATGTGGVFTVTGTHTYAVSNSTAPYAMMVTIIDPSGQTAQATSTAIIATGGTITPIPTTTYLQTGSPPAGPVNLGSFLDPMKGAAAGQFTATIDWGDGTVSAGMVTETAADSGLFLVGGTHVYAAPSTYNVTITVQDQAGNSTTIRSTAVVTNVSPGSSSFTGRLANVVTNGPYAARGFTNTNRPVFGGTAAAYSTVDLYARHFHTDALIAIGEAVADSNGVWTLTSSTPLAAGRYVLTATLTVPGGYPVGSLPLHNADGSQIVAIDMVPKHHHKASNGPTVRAHRRMTPSSSRVRHHRS